MFEEPYDEQADMGSAEPEPATVRVRSKGAALSGIVDVLTFRALIRAAHDLWTPAGGQKDEADLNQAIVKVINTNGALAKALLDVTR